MRPTLGRSLVAPHPCFHVFCFPPYKDGSGEVASCKACRRNHGVVGLCASLLPHVHLSHLMAPPLLSYYAWVQDTARDSGMLLWVMFLAMDTREPDMAGVAGHLLRSLTDGDARSLGVLTRSFPPGLLSPSPPDQVTRPCRALHALCISLIPSDPPTPPRLP